MVRFTVFGLFLVLAVPAAYAAEDRAGRYVVTGAGGGIFLVDTMMGRTWIMSRNNSTFVPVTINSPGDVPGLFPEPEESTRGFDQLAKREWAGQEVTLDMLKSLLPRQLAEKIYQQIIAERRGNGSGGPGGRWELIPQEGDPFAETPQH